MFRVSLCGLTVELDNRCSYVEALCANYRLPAGDTTPADFRVSVPGREIETYAASCGRPMTLAEAESALLYRRICQIMPRFDAFLLHAAVLCMDGRGYAFSARRGTGKSTHLSLWQACYGDRVTVVNGDKPLLRRGADGHWWVFGTPWAGKEGLNSNTVCPLNAVVFLEQGPVNRITPAATADTAARILEGTILPPDPATQDRMAALVGSLTRDVPAYVLSCRPDREAAMLACATLQNA